MYKFKYANVEITKSGSIIIQDKSSFSDLNCSINAMNVSIARYENSIIIDYTSIHWYNVQSNYSIPSDLDSNEDTFLVDDKFIENNKIKDGWAHSKKKYWKETKIITTNYSIII